MTEREFRGIWIPAEIWLDKDLSALDKVIFAEIDSLDLDDTHCYASNEYLAQFCNCSVRSASASIQLLISKGYIEVISFDGRRRVLQSRLAKSARQISKISEADLQNLPAINIDDNHSRETKENILLSEDKKEVPVRGSNMAYQHIVDLYHQLCPSLPKVAKLTPERERAIKARLKEFSHDEFITAFKKAEASAFLKGANGGWKANFDFIMRAGSMVKILEGQYDKLHLNGKGTPNPYDMAEYNDLPF